MRPQINTLTFDECDKLLRYLQQPRDDEINPRVYHRNYAMALIMLDTGIRVGELVQLRQSQLWFCEEPVQALNIEIIQAKNKHARTIPTTTRLREAIEQMHRQWWLSNWPEGTRYAFYQTRHTFPLTTRQIQRIIKSASAQSIGREVHPHLLRHTFASRLMRKTSMRVVQQLLGHSSISSTQIYTHPNGDDCRKAIDALNEKE